MMSVRMSHPANVVLVPGSPSRATESDRSGDGAREPERGRHVSAYRGGLGLMFTCWLVGLRTHGRPVGAGPLPRERKHGEARRVQCRASEQATVQGFGFEALAGGRGPP